MTTTPYMLRRVHRLADEDVLRAAIVEYRAFALRFPEDDLTPALLSVVDDCEEELQLRQKEE